MSRRPRVVVLGGGSGLAAPLLGLKELLFSSKVPWQRHWRQAITAIVAVTDDGGSSGRLRRESPMLAPGDLRSCLLALADAEPTLKALFGHRFGSAGTMNGHSLGNLMIAALTELSADPMKALRLVSRILKVRGTVLPCTSDNVELVGYFWDAPEIVGESSIRAARRRIERVALLPNDVKAPAAAVSSILDADLVVLGPGSLYTSLIPVLLVKDLCRALMETRAPAVLVANLMTEPGETDGAKVSDLLRAIAAHCEGWLPQWVLVNMDEIPIELCEHYASQESVPIDFDGCAVEALGCCPMFASLVSSNSKVRHDPLKLGKSLLQILEERRSQNVASVPEESG